MKKSLPETKLVIDTYRFPMRHKLLPKDVSVEGQAPTLHPPAEQKMEHRIKTRLLSSSAHLLNKTNESGKYESDILIWAPEAVVPDLVFLSVGDTKRKSSFDPLG
jgi:hypothetical protein